MELDGTELRHLLTDLDYREALAESSYYRECQDTVARRREAGEDRTFYCTLWESLTDADRRSYRTTVAECLDQVLRVAV